LFFLEKGGIAISVIRLIFGLIAVLSVFGALNYYISRRLYQSIIFVFPDISIKAYVGICILVVLAITLGFARSLLPFPVAVKSILGRISAYSMGIFAYLLLLFITADLLVLIGNVLNVFPRLTPQSISFFKGLIVVLLTTGLFAYGIYNGNQINHVSYDVQMVEKALANDMKIVLISDLHLGALGSEKRLPRIVQGINDQKPDIVCIAGDIFDNDYNALRNPDKVIELLKNIKATYGVYACLGNHDAGKTFNDMLNFLEQSNIKLLNDDYAVIEDRLVLIGRVDPSPIGGFGNLKREEAMDRLIASVDTNMPIVVMDHAPSNLEQYGSEIDLVVSGHTHRGQFFPFNLITRKMFILDYGHYRKDADSPHLIVTSGVNTWGPSLRIGTSNEIVSISLSARHQTKEHASQ
jgi:predicted MPP superfamily phosphohydrolase